ncbi:17637_t:CDS:2 [Entrophospora sp. SA101]|nr:17637_t:CDS:2 [Entrophospora sp. SA101]
MARAWWRTLSRIFQNQGWLCIGSLCGLAISTMSRDGMGPPNDQLLLFSAGRVSPPTLTHGHHVEDLW